MESLGPPRHIGRAQVERFYGSITTTPYFVACVTSECDVRFGPSARLMMASTA